MGFSGMVNFELSTKRRDPRTTASAGRLFWPYCSSLVLVVGLLLDYHIERTRGYGHIRRDGDPMFVGTGGLLVPINPSVACHTDVKRLQKFDEQAS